jgi:hypothetical protein
MGNCSFIDVCVLIFSIGLNRAPILGILALANGGLVRRTCTEAYLDTEKRPELIQAVARSVDEGLMAAGIGLSCRAWV